MPPISRIKNYLGRSRPQDSGQPQGSQNSKSVKPTAFIHLPKTGAAALSSYLRKKLNVTNVLIINSRRELAFMRDDELAQHDFFVAHTNAMILRRLPECYKITLLRDPLARVLACYTTSRNDPRDTVMARQARQLSLFEFVSSSHPTISTAIENVQVKRLILDLSQAEQAQSQLLSRLSSEELIDRARDSLDKLDVVGRLENMETTLKQIRDLYALDTTEDFQFPNANVQNVDTDNVDKRVKRVIRERTKLDQLLYEEVRARFG